MMQMRIVRDQLLDLRIRFVDVLRISRQRGPAKWAYAAAEERSDVFGHEAGKIESAADAGVEGNLPDIVAVVEDRQTHGFETQQVLDVLGHRQLRGGAGAGGIASAALVPLFDAPSFRQVAVDGVVGRGLIGKRVGLDTPLE
jgi:hypothetical protein